MENSTILKVQTSNDYWFDALVASKTESLKCLTNFHFPYLTKHPPVEKVQNALGKDFKGGATLIRYRSALDNMTHKEYTPSAALFEVKDKAVITVYFESHNSLVALVHTKTPDCKLQHLIKLMKTVTEIPEDDEIRWKFVFQSMTGFNTYSRKLDCPSFKDIHMNYPNYNNIEWLTKMDKPYENGKLIFWYGVPGTGKTYAIRALAQSWKHADFLYITQPESFFKDFGGMYNVLLDDCDCNDKVEVACEGTPDKKVKKDRFKVLVIEDALDLLLTETRKQDSSTISRLLNLTEGIIGQGLRLVVLITSNEKHESVDEAFMRPGRCLQMSEFRAFDTDEAGKWLKQHDVNGGFRPSSAMTLAQLYEATTKSKTDKQQLVRPKKKAGFTPR